MKQEIHITLQFDLTTGKAMLNEIVYRLEQLRNPLMVTILEQILIGYDELISDRLRGAYSSKEKEGLGHHTTKNGSKEEFCRCRSVRKRGYRSHARQFSTIFGKVRISLRVVECCQCGARYSPLLDALKIDRYTRKEANFEHEVIEAVIDNNYQRLVDGRSIDISLGGIHNIVVGSDIDQTYQGGVDPEHLSAIMADGTGVKQHKGRKGELRAVVGVTH